MKISETNRPDWDEAPEWARWWAVDSDGSAYWYEQKPEYEEWIGVWSPMEVHGHMCGDSVMDRSGMFEMENPAGTLTERPS